MNDASAKPKISAEVVKDVPLERLIATAPTALRKVISVLRFEFRRTRTVARSSVWLLLVLFPVLITGLLQLNNERAPDNERAPEEVWGIVLYGLIPQAVCLLGLLLWVCPLLNAELEGRTWIYLAVRPSGRYAMLLGKYVNGILWTASAGIVGLTLALLIGKPPVYSLGKLYAVLTLLVVCSCMGYGAVYAALGVLFPRRAIVIAVAYMLIFEVLISNIPAVVNQFTIQYRLFNILLRAMDWRFPSRAPLELSEQSVLMHLLILCGIVAVYLTVALVALRFREYATAEQN